MGDDKQRRVFDNPLILYSEHKRVLQDAIRRGDERAKEAERRGRYKGTADTLLLTVLLAVIAAIAGFNFGIGFCDQPGQGICVPMYDNTGFERCQ